jgi:hypothetical protein
MTPANFQPLLNGLYILLIALILTVVIGSFFWAINDAEKRGSSGCLILLLFLVLPWPIGLIVWLFARPTEGASSYAILGRSFEIAQPDDALAGIFRKMELERLQVLSSLILEVQIPRWKNLTGLNMQVRMTWKLLTAWRLSIRI